MEHIINDDGSVRSLTFFNGNQQYRFVGLQVPENNATELDAALGKTMVNILNTIDEFINEETGERFSTTRRDLYHKTRSIKKVIKAKKLVAA